MIKRVDFDDFPPHHVRRTWCDWLRHHTIDPNDVVVPGFVEADYDAYRISYLTHDLDDQGHRTWDAMVVRVVQLEARPSPFPDASRIEQVGSR